MGYTRARRYARYKGGNKSRPLEEPDPVKSRAAEIFHAKWREAAEDEEYLKLKKRTATGRATKRIIAAWTRATLSCSKAP